MISTAQAFAPANISCIFKVYRHRKPRWMGSYGLGFTLDEGVIAEASIARRNEVMFNKKCINFPTVADIIKRLTGKKVRIRIKTSLPLGCGFGLSGASALASSYAINKLLKLRISRKKLAIMAHIAEVENKTGLGDVVNQYYGGFCMKLRPSSHFIVKKLPINDIDVYCRHFSTISTESVITDAKLISKLNSAASMALSEIQKLEKRNEKVQFNEIIKVSKWFALSSSLLKDRKTIQTIAEIEKKNGNASMIMLGNSVFSDKHFKDAMKFKITNRGAHVA